MPETCRCGEPATWIVDWFGVDDEPMCDEHVPEWVRRKARMDARLKKEAG